MTLNVNEGNQYKKKQQNTKIDWRTVGIQIGLFFAPALASLVFFLIIRQMEVLSLPNVPLVVLYILTLVWLVVVLWKKWLKSAMVTVSLVCSILSPLIYDVLVVYGVIVPAGGSQLDVPYIYTYILGFFYTFPSAIVGLLIHTFIYRKHKKENPKK